MPVQLAPFLYPVISLSTNIEEPSHVYLLEDGLDLWLAVLENSPAITPELLVLCENILPIIGERRERGEGKCECACSNDLVISRNDL